MGASGGSWAGCYLLTGVAMDYYATRLGFLRDVLRHHPDCVEARLELARLEARLGRSGDEPAPPGLDPGLEPDLWSRERASLPGAPR